MKIIKTSLKKYNRPDNSGAVAVGSVVVGDDVHQFTINNLYLIQKDGRMFVAFPDKIAVQKCKHCHKSNSISASFCNFCGEKIEDQRQKAKYMDVVVPATVQTRQLIETVLIEAFNNAA